MIVTLSDIVILVYLVVHPYALGSCGDCLLPLFATLDPPSEFEEGCEGETFAGEAEEEPGTTGKPPLALASFLPIIACICFGFKNCIIPITELLVALRHSILPPQRVQPPSVAP